MKLILLTCLLSLSCLSYSATRFARVMFYGNASTNAVIGWDQVSGDFTNLKFGTDSTNLNQSFKLSSQNKTKGMHNSFIRLNGLKAKTKYFFKIIDSEGSSRIYHFSTVTNNPKDGISFIGGGDSRSRSAVRRKANLMVAKLKPHAVLFDGDFTAIDITKEWIQWFKDWELTTGKDGRITPIVPARGNHERSNRVMIKIFDAPNYRINFSTQFGGDLINVIALNSEICKGGFQTRFLKKELKEKENYKWQLPMYHRPMRAHVSYKREMDKQVKHWVPLFEKTINVRLALECDSHTCKSTWPIVSCENKYCDEGFRRDDDRGIVYIGEGCWGAPPRSPNDQKSWTRDAEMNDSFKWIFVTTEKIEVRTVLYTNSDIVAENTEENPFLLPKGIEIWNPSNGAVVTIFPRK